MERFHPRHSSCLWFQISGVEALSFLPDMQGDRSNLPGQGQAGHLRPHPFSQQGREELVKRPGFTGGDNGCTLKQVLQIVIVVFVQPANRGWLASPTKLPFDRAMIGAAARLNAKPTVGP